MPCGALPDFVSILVQDYYNLLFARSYLKQDEQLFSCRVLFNSIWWLPLLLIYGYLIFFSGIRTWANIKYSWIKIPCLTYQRVVKLLTFTSYKIVWGWRGRPKVLTYFSKYSWLLYKACWYVLFPLIMYIVTNVSISQYVWSLHSTLSLSRWHLSTLVLGSYFQLLSESREETRDLVHVVWGPVLQEGFVDTG